MELEAFELVFLRRPPDAPELDEATLERIQRAHLAFHERLRDQGLIVTNGPVIDPPDASLRGLTFYRTGSLDEARRLAEQDGRPGRPPGGRGRDLVVPPRHDDEAGPPDHGPRPLTG